MKHIFIVAGDASGDIYGAQVIEQLQQLGSYRFSGLGGDAMAQTNMNFLYHLVDEFSVMGFLPVILGMPKVMRFLEITLDSFDQDPPDLLLVIDYPGFNMYLATHAAKRKIPVVYYVTPQIWAWAPWRIKKIKKYFDKMLVIFPFEVPFYERAGVAVEYVGHPLLDRIAKFEKNDNFSPVQDLQERDKVLAILPGSRSKEIKANLPVMLQAAWELYQQKEVAKVLLAQGSRKNLNLIEQSLAKFSELPVEVVIGDTYNVIVHARLALVTSGTATLETAILKTPLVVCYRLPRFHHWVFQKLPFISCPYIALPNIISERMIVPEHVFAGKSPASVMEDAKKLWDGEKRAECLEDLQKLRERVASPGASANAARAIEEFLENHGATEIA